MPVTQCTPHEHQAPRCRPLNGCDRSAGFQRPHGLPLGGPLNTRARILVALALMGRDPAWLRLSPLGQTAVQ